MIGLKITLDFEVRNHWHCNQPNTINNHYNKQIQDNQVVVIDLNYPSASLNSVSYHTIKHNE